MKPKALVVRNPAARQARRFGEIEPEIEKRYEATVVDTDRAGVWSAAVRVALARGVRHFIAAGGDGTVHALVNALVEHRGSVALGELTLGAVGLGSSNDYHKPAAGSATGIPLRLDPDRAGHRDLVLVRYRVHGEPWRQRVFLLSASVGVTASACALFNRGDLILRALKRIWLGAAILYAALRTILGHANIHGTIRMRGASARVAISNMSQMKTPHLAGGLRFDTPVSPASGRLAVNLCEDMGRLRVLRTLASLARGRFRDRPGTRHWSTPSLQLDLTRAQDLELDGEVVRARSVRFDVLPRGIRACA